MRARAGAILSVAGVLAAGAAAAIVNAQVLGGSSSNDSHAISTPDSAAVTITTATVATTAGPAVTSFPSRPQTDATTASVAVSSSTAVTQPGGPVTSPPNTPITSAPVTSAPGTISPGTTSPGASAPATQPPSSTATYQMAGAGSVVLRAAGDSLTVVGVSPAPGWSVHDSGNETPSSVRVRVRAADGAEVRFEASVVLGVISTSVEQSPGSGGGGGDDGSDDGSDD